jgi:hypothetical protein
VPAIVTTRGADADGIKRVPMTKIRKKIAERLVQAQQTGRHPHHLQRGGHAGDLRHPRQVQGEVREAHGVGLGFMSFFARASVLALREFPRVNGQIDGDDVIYHDHVNLGIAVSTDRGLAVPVLRNVERWASPRSKARSSASPPPRAKASSACRNSRRHVHDHQRRRVRLPALHADHQPPAERHPRHARDPEARRWSSTTRS